jgi:hypothetical protein
MTEDDGWRSKTRNPPVVGHSNTLPDLLRCLGHPAAETIADDDFGSLFVLVPRPGLPPAVVRIRY